MPRPPLSTSSRSRRAGGRALAVTLFLLAAAAGIGFGIWWLARGAPVKVALRAVESGRVELTVANTRAGTVKSPRRARLAPSMGGQVVKLPIREGDRVAKGDLLLELWNDDLRASLELARASAKVTRARAVEACALARVAASKAEREKKLSQGGIASEERVEVAQAEADAGEASCKAALAAAEEAEARIAAAQATLDKTILRAPFNGVVAQLNAELGEFVTPSPPGIPTPPAVDLIEDGRLYISAPIDEVDAPRVRMDLPARVTLDAFPGQSFPGRVRRIAPFVLEIEKQARTVDVEVELTESSSSAGLLPGYSADVEVLLDARDAALRIPSEAVYEGNKVLVFHEGLLEERRIEHGISNWEFTEVLSGLQEGERVVVSLGREGVQPGARAAPEEAAGGRTAAASGP